MINNLNNNLSYSNYSLNKKATPVQFKATKTEPKNTNLDLSNKALDYNKFKKDYVNIVTALGAGVGAALSGLAVIGLRMANIGTGGNRASKVVAGGLVSAALGFFARYAANLECANNQEKKIKQIIDNKDTWGKPYLVDNTDNK